MSYLINYDGVTMRVRSLDGYDPALLTVLDENVPEPPSEFCQWDGNKKKWVEDKQKKDKGERKAKARAMTREDLLDRIDDLEARLTSLEKKQK